MTNSLERRTPGANEIKKLNVRQIAQIRAMVPIGRIVRRLGGFAVGDWETVRTGPETYEERPIEMNANQVRAGIALLNKWLPDLQSMQLEVTKNDFDGLSLEDLRARFRSIITDNAAIDVQATMVQTSKNDLLSLEPDSKNDLLSID